jgi:hypothetical protein
MSAQPTRGTAWLPGLVDLLARRPELEGVGLASIGREVSS